MMKKVLPKSRQKILHKIQTYKIKELLSGSSFLFYLYYYLKIYFKLYGAMVRAHYTCVNICTDEVFLKGV